LRRRSIISVREADAGGTPVYWADLRTRFVVGLVARVGRSDETLADGGVTHLVEHLAIPTDIPGSVDVNGTVRDAVTLFWAAGPEQLVLDTMRRIAKNLAEPPLERLETERQILLTEAAAAGDDPVRTSMLLRFGTTKHGLPGYDEYGLYRLDADAVATWARRYFTRGNTAIWMTRKPPRGFRLPFHDGEPMPAPAVEPIPGLTLPALYDQGPEGSVALSCVARRSAELVVVLAIAATRLRERLRYTSGVSYSVDYLYESLTGDTAHVTVWADTLEHNAETVRDGLHETLHELARLGPNTAELERQVEIVRNELADPEEATSYLAESARDSVLRRPPLSEKQLLAELESVTPERAANALREALETELLVVPWGTRRGRDGLDPYPFESQTRVEGRRHRLSGLRAPRDVSLLLADEGVTMISGKEQATVLFSECEALLTWADGRRCLWGRDGCRILLDPADWRNGQELVRSIDASVGDDVRVPMDRDLLERIESVERAAGGRVKRGFMTKRELDSLPQFLDRGEQIVCITRASLGWSRAGLLVVTDRRLLFLYFDELVVDAPLWEVGVVSQHADTFWSDNKLVLSIGTDDRSFSDIEDETLEDLVCAVEQANPPVGERQSPDGRD
jgi:zinc protease